MPVTHDRRLAERILAVRKRNGIRQKDLAKAVGISQGALTNFEKARRRVSIDWLKKIAVALDTPLSYFLEDDPRPSAGHPKERRLLRAWRELAPVLQRVFLRLIIDLSRKRRRRT